MPERYAFDTNVYIRALRSPHDLAALKSFGRRVGPRLELNAVVALELRAGALTDAQLDAVSKLAAPYAARGLVLTPSFEAYLQAGRVLSALAVRERMPLASAPRSLVNDALIAASCREADVVLITDNLRDFAAIQRHLRGFRFREADRVL